MHTKTAEMSVILRASSFLSRKGKCAVCGARFSSSVTRSRTVTRTYFIQAYFSSVSCDLGVL